MHKLRSFMVFVFVGLISISSFAQTSSEEADFYYDEFGWRVSISAGTILFEPVGITFDDTITNTYQGNVVDKHKLDYNTMADLEETLFPSLALRLEFKPYKGLATDFEAAYFVHDIAGSDPWRYRKCTDATTCTEETQTFEGSRRNIVGLAGGTFYL